MRNLILLTFLMLTSCRAEGPIMPDTSRRYGICTETFRNTRPDSLGVVEMLEIGLPSYSRGIYYSQDDYYDYWQVNGNRVLPWMFTPDTFADIFIEPAYGVDDQLDPDYKSSAMVGRTRHVSRYGVFMQLELADGRYMSLLPLAGPDAVCWLNVADNGALRVEVGTYGSEPLDGRVPALAWGVGENINEATWHLFEGLRSHDLYSGTLRLRHEKPYPEMFEYLGWCTWEEYKKEISAELISVQIAKLKNSPLPVRYAIIDDGHPEFENDSRERKQRLTSFSPNDKFPEGFAPLLAMRDEKLKWMGLWQNFNGYWGGFSLNNDFDGPVASNLISIPQNGFVVPGPDTASIRTVYDAFLGKSARDGMDFLKVDWQAANLHMHRFGENAARQAFATSRTVDDIAKRDFSGAMINCMAMNNVVLLNARNVNVTRTSIDYKMGNMFMAKEHLAQSYHNAMYICPTVWGDQDMFHTTDPVCGPVMALSKAVSGGPVYLSDAPDNIARQMVEPLCYDDGKLLRPLAPATVLQRSAFTSPLTDGSAYCVSAPLSNGAAAVVAYNLSVKSDIVESRISAEDYALTGTLMQPYAGKWEIPAGGLYVYDYFEGCGGVLDGEMKFSIEGFDHKYFLIMPIVEGWALIGRIDKYLAPVTVVDPVHGSDSLSFTMEESGPVDFWIEQGEPFSKGIDFIPRGDGLWRAMIPAGEKNKTITIHKL